MKQIGNSAKDENMMIFSESNAQTKRTVPLVCAGTTKRIIIANFITMRKLISLFCIIWLCANEATGCANNLKIKIIYAPATLQTVFSISPEYFDKGYINHSTDSVYVECDSLIYDFFNCIQALKVSDQNSRYNSIVKPYHTNVRGKVLLYKEDQVVKVYYIGQFLVLYNDTLYDIDEKLRKNIDSMIKKGGGTYMWHYQKTFD